MNDKILQYYNDLAEQYDEDRFSHSYGKYIDQQERQLLQGLLSQTKKEAVLDMACGTGRFLDMASYGIDISPKMIEVAQRKYPNKQLSVQEASQTHFPNASFSTIFSFHLMMHLDKQQCFSIIDEAHRLLKPNGRLIFDIPSRARRQLMGYQYEGWHGSLDFFPKEMIQYRPDHWKVVAYQGIAFFPIHRFPHGMRKSLIPLDTLLCQSIFKKWASYLVFTLEKK
ncbi:MAG: class I SAM-dependent methyltransferase [Bacteroidota bacterium]